MIRLVSKKTALSAVAAIAACGAVMTPVAVSAQSYGSAYGQPYGYGQQQPSYGYGQQNYGYQQPYNDRCETLERGRTGAGGLIGATVGAVAGSQIASRGRRTEGSILGGVLGAVVGASVGRASNDNCRSYDQGYAQSGYGQPSYGYDDRNDGYDAYDPRYDNAQSYGYGDNYYEAPQPQYGSNYGYVSDGYSQNCRSVQTTRRTYDGRTVTEYREVC